MVLQIVLQCLTRCSFKGKNSIRLHRLSYNDGMYVYNDQTFSAQWSLRGGGGYSHIMAMRVCAAGKGIVFKPFTLGWGLVIIENWSSIGSRLTESLTKD